MVSVAGQIKTPAFSTGATVQGEHSPPKLFPGPSITGGPFLCNQGCYRRVLTRFFSKWWLGITSGRTGFSPGCTMIDDGKSANTQLRGVMGRFCPHCSYSKGANFNGAYSSCRPIAAIKEHSMFASIDRFYSLPQLCPLCDKTRAQSPMSSKRC